MDVCNGDHHWFRFESKPVCIEVKICCVFQCFCCPGYFFTISICLVENKYNYIPLKGIILLYQWNISLCETENQK